MSPVNPSVNFPDEDRHELSPALRAFEAALRELTPAAAPPLRAQALELMGPLLEVASRRRRRWQVAAASLALVALAGWTFAAIAVSQLPPTSPVSSEPAPLAGAERLTAAGSMEREVTLDAASPAAQRGAATAGGSGAHEYLRLRRLVLTRGATALAWEDRRENVPGADLRLDPIVSPAIALPRYGTRSAS